MAAAFKDAAKRFANEKETYLEQNPDYGQQVVRM